MSSGLPDGAAKNSLRVVYMGTPEFAVPALDALHEQAGVEVVLVVSQPDRPSGRGQRLQPPPVAARAHALGIPVFQPEGLRDAGAVERLREAAADLFVVAAYGQILREEVLSLPAFGCVNIHASLLPRWRGAAPIHWSVVAGDAVTGVSIMRMERGLDTGPVYAMAATMIGATETSGELHDRLSVLGAQLLIETLPAITGAAVVPTVQAGDRTCYARMLSSADRALDFSEPARAVAWRINGMSPWPGSRTHIDVHDVCLLRARLSELDVPAETAPGTVLRATPADGLHIACGDGCAIEVLEIKRPGKRAVSAADCLRGIELPVGVVAGAPVSDADCPP